ncbi:hypothetical protein BO83DRAFT_19740 [Aspergillus eucalypticola CBS 122712]|uniref:Uncharacterized protein n=1 Tax=Aspergillus eucalypticola (strain CBS 122712 / IBT 29274) TaxID=1448314 RepID=A0A317VPG5_ASPEC|nr:uncharacterized protein BO83DRAFT_19740 [Aspergillus eucalypticola CBS 122712]PWY74957.1 hypothetical protein BO83DRAFT_19740 [Aspergillus eucalypticola CBS 122712]
MTNRHKAAPVTQQAKSALFLVTFYLTEKLSQQLDYCANVHLCPSNNLRPTFSQTKTMTSYVIRVNGGNGCFATQQNRPKATI